MGLFCHWLTPPTLLKVSLFAPFPLWSVPIKMIKLSEASPEWLSRAFSAKSKTLILNPVPLKLAFFWQFLFLRQLVFSLKLVKELSISKNLRHQKRLKSVLVKCPWPSWLTLEDNGRGRGRQWRWGEGGGCWEGGEGRGGPSALDQVNWQRGHKKIMMLSKVTKLLLKCCNSCRIKALASSDVWFDRPLLKLKTKR